MERVLSGRSEHFGGVVLLRTGGEARLGQLFLEVGEGDCLGLVALQLLEINAHSLVLQEVLKPSFKLVLFGHHWGWLDLPGL